MRVTVTQPNVYDSYGILMPPGSVKTVDNNFGASLVFANRATDTDGILGAPTNKPFDISIETPIYPIVLTAAGIQAAINAVSAAGGGVVQLPAATIALSTSLIMLSGVTLKGVAPQLLYNTIPDSGLTTLFPVGTTGGTVLAPTGAFPAVTWSTAALVAPASQTAFSQTGLTNIRFENLGFLGGSHGILGGGTNNAACWYSQFVNLYFTGQTVCGEALTNYQHCQFNGRYFFGCAWSYLHQIDVSAASLAPGNSTYIDTYCCNPSGSGVNALLARNATFITTATTGGAANNNEFKFDRMQSNRFGGTTITQAATMVNTQANITITDGTKFAVDLPVSVDATQNGFVLKKVYFVISVAGNVIQLSNTMRGAAITATGAVAVNIVHTGFPCFEMIALAGSTNTNVTMDNVDVEGLSTAAMVFQNCNGGLINVSQVPSIAQATQSIVCRGCANMIFMCPQSVSTDWDNGTSGGAMGFYGARFGVCVGYVGYGQWYDSVSGNSVTSNGNINNTQSAGDITFLPGVNNGINLAKNFGFANLVVKGLSGATANIANFNTMFVSSTAASVNTLMALNNNNGGGLIGIINTSAGTQTYNTAGELINGVAGRNSFVLNAGASIYLGSTASIWIILGASSAMAAGVVSAPT